MNQHGIDCPKLKHLGSGYLHAEDDDRPYDVDGLSYCGRCHAALDVNPTCPVCRTQQMLRAAGRAKKAIAPVAAPLTADELLQLEELCRWSYPQARCSCEHCRPWLALADKLRALREQGK